MAEPTTVVKLPQLAALNQQPATGVSWPAPFQGQPGPPRQAAVGGGRWEIFWGHLLRQQGELSQAVKSLQVSGLRRLRTLW